MKRPQLTQAIIDRNYSGESTTGPEFVLGSKDAPYTQAATVPGAHVHDKAWFDSAPLPPIDPHSLYRFCALCQRYRQIGDLTEEQKRAIDAEIQAKQFQPGETVVYLNGTKCRILTVADQKEKVIDHLWVYGDPKKDCFLVPIKFLKRHSEAEQKRDRQEIEQTALQRAAQLAAEEIVKSILTVEPTDRISDARRFAEIIYRNVRNQREL